MGVVSVGLAVLAAATASTGVTGTAHAHTNADLRNQADIALVHALGPLGSGAIPPDAHSRIVTALQLAAAQPAAHRQRRQVQEVRCNNLDEDLWSHVFAEVYTANLVAGITFLIIIAIILVVAWYAGVGAQLKELKAMKNAADADGDGKVSLEEMLGYTASKAAPILGEGGALTEALEVVERVGSLDADGDGHISASEALGFAKKLHTEATPLIARARAGSINPEAKQAVDTIDKMLGIATGDLGSPDAAEAAAALAAAGGVEVTVEDAFSFAQHMSTEGRKLLDKAQQSPAGSIAPDALKTLSLVDSAINAAVKAEVEEFARTRVKTMSSVSRSGSFAVPPSTSRSGTVSVARLRAPPDLAPTRRRIATTPSGTQRPAISVADADTEYAGAVGPVRVVSNPAHAPPDGDSKSTHA